MLFTSTIALAQENFEDINYDDNGRFAVQVEAWQSDVKAEQRVSYWKDQGFSHSSFAEDGDQMSGDVWYRVFLGRFATMDDAQQFQEVFANNFDNQTWITTTMGEPLTVSD
jgi:hypothetical protein